MNRFAVYLTLALAAGLAIVSLALITPSLPALQQELGISMTELAASQAAYLLCMAVPQLFYGSFSDRIGRRLPLLVGIAIFVAGSIAATFAFDFWSLTFARLLQAAGASSGMVTSRSIMRDMHPEGRMASVMGFLAMAIAVLPMIAPALGGLVQDSFGWRGNFWLLAAMGALLLVASSLWLPGGSPAEPRRQPSLSVVRTLLASDRFRYFTLQFALSSALNQLFFITAPFVMEREFALAPSTYGIWFSLPSLCYLLGNLASGIYAERAGIVRMVMIGTVGAGLACALCVAGMWLLGTAPALPFLVMASVALFHGLVVPSAMAGSTGAIAGAFGLASGLAGCIQALTSASVIMLASARVDTALVLVLVLSALSWLCALFALLLRPRQS